MMIMLGIYYTIYRIISLRDNVTRHAASKYQPPSHRASGVLSALWGIQGSRFSTCNVPDVLLLIVYFSELHTMPCPALSLVDPSAFNILKTSASFYLDTLPCVTLTT